MTAIHTWAKHFNCRSMRRGGLRIDRDVTDKHRSVLAQDFGEAKIVKRVNVSELVAKGQKLIDNQF